MKIGILPKNKVTRKNKLITLFVMIAIAAIILHFVKTVPTTDNFFVSMFLDRWTHYKKSYAYANLVLSLFFLTGLYLTGKHSKKYTSIILILIITYPVFYSLVTFLTPFAHLDSKGFSGIASALFGYLVWMTAVSMLNKSTSIESKFMKTTWFMAALALLAATSVPMIFSVTTFTDGVYVIKNIWSHYIGFIYGLIVPTLIYAGKGEKFTSKIDETGIFGLVFITIKTILII